MALDPENPSSIRSCAQHARENARAIRGSITSEMWEVLNGMWLEMQQMDEEHLNARGISSSTGSRRGATCSAASPSARCAAT